MKGILLSLLTGAIAFSASARLNGDGYYRVHNYMSNRYVYVMDDKGSLDFQSSTAEVGAIELWQTPENRISDPASVIYVKDINGKNQDFDFLTQGTGVHNIITHYVSVIIYNNNLGTYRIFGRNSGMTRYIGDGTKDLDYDRGYVSTTDKGDWCNWYFSPIDSSNDDEYFGVTPTVQVGSDYYQPFFADFPFSTASSGMEVYYVNTIDAAEGIAVMERIEGVVPQATPVLVKCSSANPSNNRLDIGGSAQNLTDNKLRGVYFENYDRLRHNNLTPYDPSTMRLLSTSADGKLVYSTSTREYLPRNQAYLAVPAGSPAELKLMTRDDYNQYLASKTYTLTYMVDDQVYATSEYKAGETIVPPTAPEREGYTFSGWQGLPEVMPAQNLTVTASFAINTYTLTYMVDDEVYATSNYKYGETIVPAAAPEREGYTFSGWQGLPEVMPAQNVTVTGSFAINSYMLRIFIDDELFNETSFTYGATVVLPDITWPEGRELDYWADVIPETMPAHDVNLHAVTKSGIEDILADMPGTTVDVYTVTGRIVLRGVAKEEVLNRLAPGLYIIGSAKVLIK